MGVVMFRSFDTVDILKDFCSRSSMSTMKFFRTPSFLVWGFWSTVYLVYRLVSGSLDGLGLGFSRRMCWDCFGSVLIVVLVFGYRAILWNGMWMVDRFLVINPQIVLAL